MKQTTVNEFKDGLNLDLHPLVTPKTVLTDNINGTFITYNGNEFCLQNDRGNKYVSSLTPGYTPIGIKEHNGILYIVSVNGDVTEIGTFPSPEYENIDLEEAYSKEWSEDLKKTYAPLHVLEGHEPLTNVNLGYTTKTPVTIEIQDSYDGSVNLILVADKCKPRIINSGFSVLPNDKYKFINRDQKANTAVYEEESISKDSELIRTNTDIISVELGNVKSGGQLKGGNYKFYFKFGDSDFNQTDVVAESGIVSIFNGTDGIPSTISGTLADERTDKMIELRLYGVLNPSKIYSKIYIYFSREYSDTQGYRMTEYGALLEPINLQPFQAPTSNQKMNFQDVWITGFEQQISINPEELNVDYHTIDWARSEAQHSNMLFLGNVGNEETFALYHELEKYTKKNVSSKLVQESIMNNNGDNFSNANYYSTHNIYYQLGYWPEEWYRFGIVYILNDGSTTPAFNMSGGIFTSLTSKIENNEYGVFKTPRLDVLKNEKPIGFQFQLNNINNLNSKVIGWFVVRQKRIPVTICQGVDIRIDKRSYLPLVYNGTNWIIESFLSLDRSIEKGEYYDIKDKRVVVPDTVKHQLRPLLEVFNGELNSKVSNVNYLVTTSKYKAPISLTNTGYDNKLLEVYKTEECIPEELPLKEDESKNIFIFQYGLIDRFNRYNHTEQIACYGSEITNKFENGEYSPFDGNLYYFYSLNDYDAPDIIMSGENISGESVSFNITGNGSDEVVESQSKTPFTYRFINEDEEKYSNGCGIVSLDPCVNNEIKAIFDGSEFEIIKDYNVEVTNGNNSLVFDNYASDFIDTPSNEQKYNYKVAFINANTSAKTIDSYTFSNVAGSSADAGSFKYTAKAFGVYTHPHWTSLGKNGNYIRQIEVQDDLYGIKDYDGYNSTHNVNLVRGLFLPYLGVTGTLQRYGIYSIKRKDINENEYTIRRQDDSEYYAVSQRYSISTNNLDVYGGDCYICRVGLRVLRNFIDNVAPVADTIVDPLTWEVNVRQKSRFGGDGSGTDGKTEIADYTQVNLSDLNAVDLGYWITFPCLSSYNLGLRSIDPFHTDEIALLGSPRSFYPLNGASTATGNKLEESFILNDGLSATVGRKRYNLMPDVPYSKSEFANRIMFSNVHITDAYTNGYRTFQGVSYKDYDKQYGAITKLIPLGQNIFVVMEHGLGLVPVNPKALMQTTTGEAIHIYGYGVLPDEMTIVSQDYGSKYEHSVIRTPIGIYGTDVDAKKVWRFSDKQGFQTISDMKIETYLKDYLEPIIVEVGKVDIRTHYNGKKGDLMFTWNDLTGNKLYSICYNERQNIWTTTYDWKPIVSENINDEFYSLNFGNKPSETTYYENECSIWDHANDVGYYNEYVSQWYDKEHNFEFEFVVSDPIGVNKIFDNLQIISNNVQPDKMEITIIGDDYEFKRDLTNLESVHKELSEYRNVEKIRTTSNTHGDNTYCSDSWTYEFDNRLNQKAIINTQIFKDIYKFGRRLGNIQYKDGSWFTQIEPLKVNINGAQQKKEVRLRDKWAKIRIKYSGKDLAIITAIKTLINI